MYRLVIVSGPNRGSSFALSEGENSIGRQMDNHIVLTSVKVSKRHCHILVNQDEVVLQDTTSTNGTFVNGTLVKNQIIKSGDRVSVGEFVLELIRTQGGAVGPMAGSTSSAGSVASLPMHLDGQMVGAVALPTESPHPNVGNRMVVEAPQDPEGKIQFIFENKFMPSFYGMLLKTEFRSVVGLIMAGVVIVSVMGSVMPIQDLAMKSIQREARIRAKVMAREVADRFLPAIANHAESQIDLSMLEGEESIKMVAITNTSMQIIAPQSRINQVLAGGPEASFANMMSRQFKEGSERGAGTVVGESLAIYVEPIKITDPRTVKSSVAAMVVVSVDFSANLLASGQLGVAVGIGFVIAGLATLLAYFIILRLSFKPYEILNDDLDQVLRGELPRVTHEFKMEETAPLWNNINAAIQRIPRLGATGSDIGGGGDSAAVDWDIELASLRAICEASGFGMLVVDQEGVVQALNPQFEEISGIRIGAIGQTVQQVARDQAFVSLMSDLKERVLGSPSRSTSDEFEFSGLNYQVVASGVGPVTASGLALVFKKKE
jgi:PAS domain-containing protein